MKGGPGCAKKRNSSSRKKLKREKKRGRESVQVDSGLYTLRGTRRDFRCVELLRKCCLGVLGLRSRDVRTSEVAGNSAVHVRWAARKAGKTA